MKERRTAAAEDEAIAEIACGCVLTRTRLVARVVTSLYDEALRPFDMGAPQFSLLVVIGRLAPASRAEIGRYNQLDRSTLTRNLRLLLAGRWIQETPPAAGGRGRPLVLTAAGRRLIVEAAPAWRAAQVRTAELLGRQGVKTLMNVGEGLLSRSGSP